MAKTLRKLGRGLAAGLLAAGEVSDKNKAEAEEKRRFEEQSARAERQLKMQEAESAARLEKNKLEVSMKRVKYNNQQMAQVGLQSKYDPRAMGPAFSKFGTNAGTSWTYNEGRSKEAGEGVIIYDIDTVTMNDDGTVKMGPDGKPEKVAMPGPFREMRFENQDDHVNFMLRAASPEWALAHDQAEVTGAQTRANAQKVHDQRMKSDPAYALKYGTEEELAKLTIAGKKADIGKTKAETRKLDRGVGVRQTPAQAPVSKLTAATGEEITQTMADTRKAANLASAMNAQAKATNPEAPVVTDDEAARVLHLENSATGQKLITELAVEVANNRMSEEEFKAKFDKSKLPASFVQSMYDKIQIIPVEEIKKKGFWGKFVDVFKF